MSFRKSQITLLDADGTLKALHLRSPLLTSGFVVLARERCLFERLDTAPGLSSRAAVAAARIHAQAAAPYQRSASLITRQGPSFGIWWWDAQWVADHLTQAGADPAAKVIPEPMARAAADGWRVVKASTGYEAQLWKNGFLMADLWRRRPFDNDAWQAFVRVQPDHESAENAVLMAQDPPYTLQSPYRRTQLSDWTNEKMAMAAGVALVVFALGGAGYMYGESIGFERNTDEIVAKTDEVRASTPKAKVNVKTAMADLLALKNAVENPDPVVMLKSAQQVMEPMGIKLVAFNADRDKVRLILPREAVDHVSAISAELEQSPYFSDVKPTIDRSKQRLILDMVPVGAKSEKAPASKAAPKDDLGF